MMRHADSFLVRSIIFSAVATASFLVSLGTFAAKGWANHAHWAHHAHGHVRAHAERKMERLAPAATLIFFSRALFPYSLICAVATSLLFTPHTSFITLLNAEGIRADRDDWLLIVICGLFFVLLWAYISAKSYAYEVKTDGIYLKHGIFHKETILVRRDEVWTIRISSDDMHSLFGLTAINLEVMPFDTGMLSVQTIPGLRFGDAKAACEKFLGTPA
jgi:membrane protein YdbS with pleckstrin-like domain